MATKKAASTETAAIIIPAMQIKEFDLRIVGDTPLISHAWSDKAKEMMLLKQTKKASTGRDAKRPMVDFAESLYWLTDKPDFSSMTDDEIFKATQSAKFGFPVLAFKSAAVDGSYQSRALDKKTTARAAFHIQGELVEIEGTPQLREDMVRIGMGVADIRYRGEFPTWATTLHIRFNSQAMSIEQIINLFNIGGFACGIGEWRPAKDGQNGMFHVE